MLPLHFVNIVDYLWESLYAQGMKTFPKTETSSAPNKLMKIGMYSALGFLMLSFIAQTMVVNFLPIGSLASRVLFQIGMTSVWMAIPAVAVMLFGIYQKYTVK